MVSLRAILLGILSAAGAHAYESNWLHTPGSLVQISFDGSNLCGVSADKNVYCADDNLDGYPSWRNLNARMKWVAVWGDDIWGVGVDGLIFHGSSQGDPAWQALDQEKSMTGVVFTQVTSDGKRLCAVSSEGKVYGASRLITQSPDWQLLYDGWQVRSLDVSDGVIISSAAADNTLWYSMADGNPVRTKVNGWLTQVAFDGSLICGVSKTNELYCAKNELNTGAATWIKYPGSFSFVEVNAGRVIAVGTDALMYTKWFTTPSSVYTLGDWKAIPGKLKQLDFDGQSMCGVTAINDIWCAKTRWGYAPVWRIIPGKLTYVSVWGENLLGITPAGDLVLGNTAGDSVWKPLLGSVQKVATDGKAVCGITSTLDCWCGPIVDKARVAWRQLPLRFKNVVLQNGVAFGVTPTGEIYSVHITGKLSFKRIPGNLVTIDFDGRNLCGSTSYDEVWCADEGLHSGQPNWQLVDGKLRSVSYVAGRMAGLTASSSVVLRNNL